MKRAALGFRMHSGWGVLVAMSADMDVLEVVDRRRIVVMDAHAPGGNQPYHYAANLPSKDCAAYIAKCAALSESMALAALTDVLRELKGRKYKAARSAVLTASGRALPSLPEILGSHPLIHTAEGEFFRDSVRKACEQLQIPVSTIRERDLEERAKSAFGAKAARMRSKIAALGKSIGPPWTGDHKAAALAALLALESH